MSVVTVKLTTNNIVRKWIVLASDLEIPFDGCVYASILRMNDHNLGFADHIMDDDSGHRIVRLSKASHAELRKRCPIDLTDSDAIQYAIIHMIDHVDEVNDYYKVSLNTGPSKISKSR